MTKFKKLFPDFERVTKTIKKDHGTGVETFLIKTLLKIFKKVPYQST